MSRFSLEKDKGKKLFIVNCDPSSSLASRSFHATPCQRCALGSRFANHGSWASPNLLPIDVVKLSSSLFFAILASEADFGCVRDKGFIFRLIINAIEEVRFGLSQLVSYKLRQ
ncbi:hypothetical protein Ancab_016934 [Ancistrocladus abbreviatus]